VRVKVNKKTGVIKIGKNPITSVKLLSSGDVALEFEFGIDISSCLKNEIQVVMLNVFGHEIPSITSTPALNNFSDGLRATVFADASEKSLITRMRTEYRVATVPVDITKLVSNDSIKKTKNDSSVALTLVKTYDSSLETINNVDFIVDTPDEKNSISIEEENRELLRLGKDPSTLKGSFPLLNPAISIKRNVSGNKKHKYESYKRIGNPTKYTTGTINSRYSSCSNTIFLSRKTISDLPILYFEIDLLNKTGVVVNREKINIFTQSIELDVKILESKNKKDEIIKYGRILNSRLDASQSPYVSLESGFLKQREGIENKDSRLIRTLIGKYHNSSYITRFTPRNQKTPRTFGDDAVPFNVVKVGNNLQIKIHSTKSGIISVGIERRDVTLFEKFRKLYGIGLDPVLVTDNSSVVFEDTNLTHDHVYEYRLFFIDNKSNTKSSSNTFVYHYSSTNVSEPASLEVTNLIREIVEENGSSYAKISFDINAKLTEAGIEVAKQFLSLNGLSENMLGLSDLETSGYKKLLIYQIDRQNLRTGEVESFGTIYESKFFDDSSKPSNLRTITPLNLLDSYKYFVRLGLRDPAALVSIQTSTKTSPIGRRGYDYKSYKFRINPKSGNLPSSLKLTSNNSLSLAENFLEFSLGIESSIESIAEDYLPIISGLSIRKTLIGFNYVSWSIVGDTTSIDHFRIYAIADGIEAFIGCAHPHVIDGSYFYEDREMFDRIGEVIYRVVPVGLNFTEFRGEASAKIVIQNNAPTFLR
jgi:hypothetical protein